MSARPYVSAFASGLERKQRSRDAALELQLIGDHAFDHGGVPHACASGDAVAVHVETYDDVIARPVVETQALVEQQPARRQIRKYG